MYPLFDKMVECGTARHVTADNITMMHALFMLDDLLQIHA